MAPTASPFVVPAWQSGDVKLENGSSPADGVVKLYLDLRDGTVGWGTVCYQVISNKAENVICKQLGYVGAVPHAAAKAKRRYFNTIDVIYFPGVGSAPLRKEVCNGIM